MADDLTGACDIAAAFAPYGGPVAVCVHPDAKPEQPDSLWILNTQSRRLSPEEAHAVVRGVGAALAEKRVVFKKIDAALRGPVGAELEGLAEAIGPREMVVAPAIPRIGRTTRGGVQYDNGVLVHETAYARDPEWPIRTANVAELLAETGCVKCCIADAETDKDLRAIVAEALQIPHVADVYSHAVKEVTEARYQPGTLDILDLDLIDVSRLQIGVVAPESGRAAVLYTQEAGRMAMAGTIDAIVSAPLNKEAMRLAGYDFEGQTQILAEITGSKRVGMILLLGNIRTMMQTTHCSLREACDAVTKERVLAMIALCHESLHTFGIPKPRIAVAGLNPHAGEGGLFGREEIEGSIPAIREAVARGIDAIGPVPADVVFVKAKQGLYDIVLAMYHDQATMAAKLLGFGEVVTVLAGLPIIRTSVGHGTALDIAGKGIADEGNFIRAIEAAVDLAYLKRGEK